MPISAMTSRSFLNRHQRQDRADAGRRQRRKNGDGMDEAFVQHAENDVHRDDRRENQDRLVGQRRFERAGGSLEGRFDAGGHTQVPRHLLNLVDSRAERRSWSQIEGKSHHRELALMIDRDGRRDRCGVHERPHRSGRERRRAGQRGIGPGKRDRRRQIRPRPIRSAHTGPSGSWRPVGTWRATSRMTWN